LVCFFSCGAYNSTVGVPVPLAATHIYDLNFFTGFGTSSIVYYILSRMFPPLGAAGEFEEMDISRYEETMMNIDEDTNSKDDSTEKGSSSVDV
jgi:NCS1 family nucleobase:cation symporter-1